MKALDVLDLLGQAEQGVRLKDIAIQLDLPESTAHRLLASLADRGYVQQHAEHGTYTLGWKLAVLARSLGSDARLVQNMRPYLDQLVRQLGQTINLAVLSNDRVMYLDCQTPSLSLALYVAPGMTLPVHATSLGKNLLANLPETEREGLLDRIVLAPLTPHTVTDKDRFRALLDQVREQGYALDLGELKPNVCCVAAPFLDDSGRARAAISMTAPRAELPDDWEETFPAVITGVAREASRLLFNASLPVEETRTAAGVGTG
jgi:IclR family acetate operon transcriptional repressor